MSIAPPHNQGTPFALDYVVHFECGHRRYLSIWEDHGTAQSNIPKSDRVSTAHSGRRNVSRGITEEDRNLLKVDRTESHNLGQGEEHKRFNLMAPSIGRRNHQT